MPLASTKTTAREEHTARAEHQRVAHPRFVELQKVPVTPKQGRQPAPMPPMPTASADRTTKQNPTKMDQGLGYALRLTTLPPEGAGHTPAPPPQDRITNLQKRN